MGFSVLHVTTRTFVYVQMLKPTSESDRTFDHYDETYLEKQLDSPRMLRSMPSSPFKDKDYDCASDVFLGPMVVLIV